MTDSDTYGSVVLVYIFRHMKVLAINFFNIIKKMMLACRIIMQDYILTILMLIVSGTGVIH